MNKNILKIFIIGLLVSTALAKDNSNILPQLSPVVKSVILPGWGEHSLGNLSRGNMFLTTEVLGWIATIFTYVESNNLVGTFQAIAADNANVSLSGKNRQFWVDVGNYDTRDDYNAEHQRWREFDGQYPDTIEWDWNWQGSDKREEFEALRIKSDKWRLGGQFIIGGIVLNHLVSAIDAKYLQNVLKEKKLEFSSYYDSEINSMNYSLQFNL